MGRPDVDRVLADFGRRVAELRLERGWVQAVLAERWGVTIGYVQRVEAGAENLTIKSMALLAYVLKTLPADLLRAPTSRLRRGPGRPRKPA